MGEEAEARAPGSRETCEWDDHVTLCPGLHGAVPADCYLREIFKSNPFALRNNPVWVMNDAVILLMGAVWPEALRPGVRTRIRMLGL